MNNINPIRERFWKVHTMLRYDIMTTVTNYLPLVCAVILLSQVLKTSVKMRLAIKVFSVVIVVTYTILQMKWILLGFQNSQRLEFLWAIVEACFILLPVIIIKFGGRDV